MITDGVCLVPSSSCIWRLDIFIYCNTPEKLHLRSGHDQAVLREIIFFFLIGMALNVFCIVAVAFSCCQM